MQGAGELGGGAKNPVLDAVHAAGVRRREVVQACEVQKAVDGVEGEFPGGSVSEFPRAGGGDGGTN
jgi:hypothetical protein